jgi:hypothetical protein
MNSNSNGPQRGLQHAPALTPPAILGKWWAWMVLAAFFLIPFFLPIPVELRRHPIIGAVGEQVHIPLLACLALLIYWKGPLRGRLWLAAAATAVLGAAIEFVQEFVGRSALFEDWLLDLIGIGLVVGFVLWRGHGRRQGLWLFIALLIYIPGQLWYLPFSVMAKYEARLTFPVLGGFDTTHHRWLWEDTSGAEIAFARADSAHGQVLRLSGGPPSRWPGAQMTHFHHDWTAYTTLVFEARVTEVTGDSLQFGLRIDDFQGRRDRIWASQSFFATDQWRTFSMQIADRKVLHGERLLDLTDVESVLVFALKPKGPFVLEVDNLRLQ